MIKEQAMQARGVQILAPTLSDDVEVLEILRAFSLAHSILVDGFSGFVSVKLDFLVIKEFAKRYHFDSLFLLEFLKSLGSVFESVINEK